MSPPRQRLKAAARRALTPLLGRTRLQPLFEALHQLSLAGQNFGEGNHPRLSGEERVIRSVAERCRQRAEPTVIFDVGANTGVYSSALIDVFGSTATIWAFEPSPSTFVILDSNLGGVGNVRLRNLGLSDREGRATLHSPGVGSKLGSVYDTSDRLTRVGLAMTLEEEVTLTTVDSFCAQEGIDRIDFVKLDVEGHELRVLEGAQRSLGAGRIDAIQFEFSAANLESRTFLKDFYDLLSGSYALHRVLQDGLYPIDAYKETHEVFKRATNYVALRRTAT